MNAESKIAKDYLDYVRDAQALRAKCLGDLMSNGWRCMKEFIRSRGHRLGNNPWLTRG